MFSNDTFLRLHNIHFVFVDHFRLFLFSLFLCGPFWLLCFELNGHDIKIMTIYFITFETNGTAYACTVHRTPPPPHSSTGVCGVRQYPVRTN